jgi:ribosomal protein S18 acetylase RimI-like enzyme
MVEQSAAGERISAPLTSAALALEPPGGSEAAMLGVCHRPADAVADRAFLFAVYAHTRFDELAVTGWSEPQKLAFLEQQFAAQDREYRARMPLAAWLVIEHEEMPAGRLYLDLRADEIRIVDLALLPQMRRQGIGGAILRDLTRHAQDLARPLSVHVERSNPARRLYDRFGFLLVQEGPVYDLLRQPTGRWQ